MEGGGKMTYVCPQVKTQTMTEEASMVHRLTIEGMYYINIFGFASIP